MRFFIGVFLLALAMTAWMSTTHAIGENPCELACEAAHEQCVETCGEHSNPMECDSDCRETLQDCTRQCH